MIVTHNNMRFLKKQAYNKTLYRLFENTNIFLKKSKTGNKKE